MLNTMNNTKIKVPSSGGGCSNLSASDFDEYKIPAPGSGCEQGPAEVALVFHDSEEALKYGIHLGDVLQRMEGRNEYACAAEKIRLIISCITEQADYSSLEFPGS